MLAGSEYLVGNALANLDVAVHVVGRQVIFEPLEAIRLQRLRQAHDIFRVQRNPGVKHQLDIIANLLPRASHKLDVFVQPLNALVRTVRQEELHCLESQLQEPIDAVRHAKRGVGVAGVAEDFVLLGTAQQFIYGPAEQLAFEVP